MHFVYVIYSLSIDKYYVGESFDADTRLLEHNSGKYVGSYTRRVKYWVLKGSIPYSSVIKSKKAEKFIKRMHSRTFIERLITDFDWLQKKFELEQS